MSSWFGSWESNETNQEITGLGIIETIDPGISSHGITIPKTVLS
jgi:hypothetical protein